MSRKPSSETKAVFCMLICFAISITWAYLTAHSDHGGLIDFRAVYFSARTALLHHDPYKESEFLQVYRDEGGSYPTDPDELRNFRSAVPICVNLPSTLMMAAPFALLPWSWASPLWMILLPAGLMIAAWLVFDLGCRDRRGLTLVLICLVLANCQLVLRLGNGTLIAASLACISVWCLVKKRYSAIAVLCLALALSIKLQEVGFIWLYFFLVGGVHRKRALQSLAIWVIVNLASIAWISSVSPHWLHELHSNVAVTTSKGDLNDPGPSSLGNTHLGMIVSLQSIVSYLRDDPSFYDPVSYALVGVVILVWAFITLRSKYSEESAGLALASITALSMLPVYHRQYDLKVLLLTIPAAIMLLAEGRRIGKIAITVTSLGIILTADIPLAALVVLNKSLHLQQDRLSGKLMSVLCARTPTIILLFEGIFYLWLFAKHAQLRGVQTETKEVFEMVSASV